MTWLGPDSIGKYLFTSGSTGMPKPTPQSQGQMTAQIAARGGIELPPDDPDEIAQTLDWMPWSHISGGNVNFNNVLSLGGTFHIDEGRPMPGLFQTTIANLKDVRPQAFGSAPIAFGMLAEAMEADVELRDAVFSRMRAFIYGGATLSDDLYDRLQKLSVAATGHAHSAADDVRRDRDAGRDDDSLDPRARWDGGRAAAGHDAEARACRRNKMEVRVKGPMVMRGYLNMPEKNAQVFDEEGFYCLGDAARFEDPAHPEKGLVFDGRVTEDFKLDSGTWVSVGTLRPDIVAACAPLVFDAVVCGQDKPFIGALVWPSPAAVKAAVEANGGDMARGVGAIAAGIREKLAAFNANAGGSSRKVARFRILTTPPSLDAGEITDKGYVNQRETQANRAAEVASLFAAEVAPGVVQV